MKIATKIVITHVINMLNNNDGVQKSRHSMAVIDTIEIMYYF